MTISRLACLIVLSSASLLAIGQSDPRAVGAEDKFARPILIVSPSFPNVEPSEKLPVEIRVTGIVTETGELTSPTYSPATGMETYIRAIDKVLWHWRFRPAVGEDCTPSKSAQVLSVWFEKKDGRPVVSVSTSVKEDEPKRLPGDGKAAVTPRTFAWRPKVDYPQRAVAAGMEGAAELLFVADEHGDVQQTTLLYSTPHKIFGEVAMEGSRRVKFTAATANEVHPKRLCIVVPFKFCLTDSSAIYPNSACGPKRTKG